MQIGGGHRNMRVSHTNSSFLGLARVAIRRISNGLSSLQRLKGGELLALCKP
jgi:hypothetical protein